MQIRSATDIWLVNGLSRGMIRVSLAIELYAETDTNSAECTKKSRVSFPSFSAGGNCISRITDTSSRKDDLAIAGSRGRKDFPSRRRSDVHTLLLIELARSIDRSIDARAGQRRNARMIHDARSNCTRVHIRVHTGAVAKLGRSEIETSCVGNAGRFADKAERSGRVADAYRRRVYIGTLPCALSNFLRGAESERISLLRFLAFLICDTTFF